MKVSVCVCREGVGVKMIITMNNIVIMLVIVTIINQSQMYASVTTNVLKE